MAENSEQHITSSPSFKTSPVPEQKIPVLKKRIIKNLVVICLGFLLLFIAYNGLSMLQSTINQQQGIGVASQAIIYAAFCVSALILPKYTIKKLGCKRTLVVSMSCYIPYIAANFYFNWFTMIPSAILVGLSAGLLWSSQCTYFNDSSVIYSTLCLEENNGKENYLKNSVFKKTDNVEHSNESVEDKGNKSVKLQALSAIHLQNKANNTLNCNDVTYLKANSEKELSKPHWDIDQCSLAAINSKDIDNPFKNKMAKKAQIIDSEEYSKLVSSVTARFFGLFGLVFRTSDIWSNLLSYYVLQGNDVLDNTTDNGTCMCGASFCNVESECTSHNLAEPSQEMRNILTGVSVMLAFFGIILVFLFLDEIEEEKRPEKFSFGLAMATCKFARKKEALLLLPLTAYIGLQQGFYIGDFTESYIACAWGVYHVGLVTICYGTSAAISSSLSGLMVKYVGRIPVMLLGAALNASINVFLLIWNPHSEDPSKFFISAAMLGAVVGIWSQLKAFYGVLFKKDEEAAFAGFYLWDSIGYCAAFSYSNYICTYIKIYILLSVSTIGMIGYLKTESIHMQSNKESRELNKNVN